MFFSKKKKSEDKEGRELFEKVMDDMYGKENCRLFEKAKSENNPNICAQITDVGLRDTCYYEFAKRLKDSNLCEKIEKDGYARDFCYADIALSLEDVSLCDKIQDKASRRGCYERLAKATGRTELFEKAKALFPTPTELAVANKDPSYCETIEKGWVRDKCFSEVAKAVSDPKLCEKIDNIRTRAECLSAIAAEKKDPSVCELINNDAWKSDCYASCVKTTLDEGLCEKIIRWKRDSYYFYVAVAKKNYSISEKIEDDFTRRMCKRVIRKALTGEEMNPSIASYFYVKW
jgi:hypothetical protein